MFPPAMDTSAIGSLRRKRMRRSFRDSSGKSTRSAPAVSTAEPDDICLIPTEPICRYWAVHILRKRIFSNSRPPHEIFDQFPKMIINLIRCICSSE